jgi:hypothetical protein
MPYIQHFKRRVKKTKVNFSEVFYGKSENEQKDSFEIKQNLKT